MDQDSTDRHPVQLSRVKAQVESAYPSDVLVPTVVEKVPGGERSFDIYSRMLRERTIFLGEEVSDPLANTVIAQLLFLAGEDPETPITIYINSPGGSVTAGMGIYDTMQYVKPKVITICTGLAASMGAVLLAGGAEGQRFALPNACIMIHQPSSGFKGQSADIQIHARYIQKMRNRLDEVLAQRTGQDKARVNKDTDRDNFMSAEEALAYGLIDGIVTPERVLGREDMKGLSPDQRMAYGLSEQPDVDWANYVPPAKLAVAASSPAAKVSPEIAA